MALIPFPNVPKLPGVPALPRSPNFPPLLRAGLGLVQSTLWRSAQVSNKWGVYDSKSVPFFAPSGISGLQSIGVGATFSTVSVDFSAEADISSFPVEKGSFANYNKVEKPMRIGVKIALTASETERGALMVKLANAKRSTDLYTIMMPEAVFSDYSLENYKFARRHDRGIDLLLVEMEFVKIRQVSAQYTQSNKGQVDKPKAAGATPQADNGKVQPQTPRPSTLKSIANKLPGLAEKAGAYLQGLVK